MMMKRLLFPFFISVVSTKAFTIQSPLGVTKSTSLVCYSVIDAQHTFETLAGLEFQLEEKEDRDAELTNIRLNPDRTVSIGSSNGPEALHCKGRWSILETAAEADRPFRMTLDRTYEGGHRRKSTDVGEFEYHVVREYHGNVGVVGDSLAVQGVIHGLDDGTALDCEVGFFSLIDATTDDPHP